LYEGRFQSKEVGKKEIYTTKKQRGGKNGEVGSPRKLLQKKGERRGVCRKNYEKFIRNKLGILSKRLAGTKSVRAEKNQKGFSPFHCKEKRGRRAGKGRYLILGHIMGRG